MSYQPNAQEMQLVEEVAYLYETAFPGCALRLHLSQSDQILPPRGRFERGDVALGPDRAAPGFRGVATAGTPGSGEVVTAFVTMGRPPTAAEQAVHERSPYLDHPVARTIFKLSPQAYERLIYHHETWTRAQLARAHRWTPLPRATEIFSLGRPAAVVGADKPPAILIGVHWLEHGGAEKMAFDTITWALAAGLRVFVVSERDAQHRLADRLPDDPRLRFLRSDRYLPKEILTVFYRNLVLRENIQAVHIHHCIPLYEALPEIKAAAPEIEVIDTTHVIEHDAGGYPRISGVWSHFIDHHHVISRELVELFRQFDPGAKVHLGRMLEREDLAGGPAMPFSLKPGARSLTIAFVGRMSQQKRPILLAAILRGLKRWAAARRIKLRVDIVGEGHFLPQFTALIARYGLEAMTTLHPANANVPAILRGADILLLPSSNEGLALVCYEAVENGAVPISTDVGAQAELVPPELLVPATPWGIVKRITGVVNRLVSEPRFYLRAIAGLRQRHEQITFDPTAYEVLMPLYRDIVRRHADPVANADVAENADAA